MKTIRSTGPLLYSVKTKGLPEGKIQVKVVRYETYEYDLDSGEFNNGSFNIHDANDPDAMELASLQKA